MERADRATWAKRIERWKDSGLTAAQFAAETGVSAKALSWWKWQLGRGEAPKPVKRRSKARKPAVSPLTFVELGTPARADALEVMMPSGVRIRVPAPVDSAALSHVLDVLEKRR
jgi:hypothetical protein